MLFHLAANPFFLLCVFFYLLLYLIDGEVKLVMLNLISNGDFKLDSRLLFLFNLYTVHIFVGGGLYCRPVGIFCCKSSFKETKRLIIKRSPCYGYAN